MRHRSLFTRASLVVLTLVLLVAPALASGRIEGRVTRSDGSGVGGVSVVVNEIRATTVTDAEGRFVFADVGPGTFSVTFLLGENAVTAQGVTVNDDSVTVNRTVDWKVHYVETVTAYGASRRTQRVPEAPASVSVIDAASIAREAPHAQLPKVLEAIPGVELAQSGVFDFNVNIRGLNNTLNRRVLTLVDGRDPASVLIGAQEWASFGLPLDEIARVEVVRGPGSALYGVNAFNGVINIISKEPRYAPGGQAEVSAGEIGTFRVAARQAGSLTDRSFYRVHATYGRTDDFFRPRNVSVEYPNLLPDVIAPVRDETRFVNVGARLDRYMSLDSLVTVEGGWARHEGNLLLSSAGRSQSLGVQHPWIRSAVQTSRWQVSGYYDGRRGTMTSLTAGSPVVDDSSKANAEVIHLRDYAGSGRLVAGLAYRYQRADTRDTDGSFTLLRDVFASHEGSLFGQVDQPIGSRVRVVLAGRLDTNSLHRREFSPKAAVVVPVSSGHTVRFSYGRAFEAASFIHYFLRTAARPPVPLAAVEANLAPILNGTPLFLASVPFLALGNDHLGVERVRALETGYSGVVARRVMVGASYYFNRVTNMITPLLTQVGTQVGRVNPTYGPYQPPASLSPEQQALVLATLRGALGPLLFPLLSNDVDGRPILAAASFTNFAQVNVQGAELNTQFVAGDGLTAEASYAWLDFRPKGGVSPDIVSANAPAHRVSGGVTYTRRALAASVRARWADRFIWNTGVYSGPVPEATVFDLTARYALGPKTAVLVNVANLFDNEHYEIFGGDLLRRRSLLTLVQSW